MDSSEDEYRKAVSKYSASFMSDSKWLRLFRAVIASGVEIERARWRTIGTDHVMEIAFPREKDLCANRFADGRFQPFEYKWIESIFIPHAFRPKADVGYERKQNTAALLAALQMAGKFEVQVSEDGVAIYGYRH